MSFINVNKVELKEQNNASEMMANTVLILASMIFDQIEEKDYKTALHRVGMLDCANAMLKNFLIEDINKESKKPIIERGCE